MGSGSPLRAQKRVRFPLKIIKKSKNLRAARAGAIMGSGALKGSVLIRKSADFFRALRAQNLVRVRVRCVQ